MEGSRKSRMGLGKPANRIGSLNEKPLHAALKRWCATPHGDTEVSVDGYVVDVVRDGVSRLFPEFFYLVPSWDLEQGGIKSALVGSLLVTLVTACIALTLVVAAG